MRVIVGHSNTDLDCLGSLALARVLFPDHHAVRSRLIHPAARTLYNLYSDHLDLELIDELPREPVDKIVVVDTRSRGRLREYERLFDPPPPVEVWDHHPDDSSDISGAVLCGGPAGANTTLLAQEAMRRGCRLAPEDATVALTGIFADTGSFTHENVTAADFGRRPGGWPGREPRWRWSNRSCVR